MIQANVSSNIGAATRERILDSAERLFVENGFDATSLRMITTDAGVNLASVNYHFHSKDALIEAVFARRIGPVNRRRLELLNACLEKAGEGPPPLEEIIRAFIEPAIMLRLGPAGADVGRLFGRTYGGPSGTARRCFFEMMREIARPFTEAFRKAAPDLPQVELLWRIHFSIGVMAHTLAGADHLKTVSAGLCDLSDPESVIERIVAYVAAGIRAPLPDKLNRS